MQPAKQIKKNFRWIKREYNNPEVIVTENGWSDEGELDDFDRIEYLRKHLEQLQTVVLNNECNLKGYTSKFRHLFSIKQANNFIFSLKNLLQRRQQENNILTNEQNNRQNKQIEYVVL